MCRMRTLIGWLLLSPALAWGQPYGFVTSGGDNSVAVVDLGEDVLVGRIPLGGEPVGSALGADGRYLWVTCTEDDSVTLIDTTTGATNTLPVGHLPTGVAVVPAGNVAFVANTGSNTVSAVFGAGSLEIPVGDTPLGVAFGGTRAYVGNFGDGTLSVIDLAGGGTVVATLPVGDFPVGLALDQAAGRLYVSNFLDDTVTVVDTVALAVTATIPVTGHPRGLALDPAAGRLYVAGFENAEVQAIDTASDQVVLSAPSGGTNPVDLALGPGSERLYVVHFQTGKSVTVLDAATLAPLTAVEVPPGPFTFAGFGPQAPAGAPGTAWLRQDRSTLRPLRPRPAAASLASRPRRPGSADDVTILDTEFAVADWRIHGPLGEQSTVQDPIGGNPGAWRRTVHYEPASACHEYAAAPYDPSLQGAVESLDFAWDRQLYQSSEPALENAAVFQGGAVYQEQGVHEVNDNAWERTSMPLLGAGNFVGPGGHPDFNATGQPLTFGYCRETAFGTTTHGIDNFQVTVHSASTTSPGELGFATPWADETGGHVFTAFVERRAGGQGAVSVQVSFEGPGRIVSSDLSWPDGDISPRSVVVQLDIVDQHVDGVLSLSSATGGATLEPTRERLILLVGPPDPPAELGGLSPAWLLALTGPGLLLAGRRRRAARGGP
jgi:YVTN family beta-propeller protein